MHERKKGSLKSGSGKKVTSQEASDRHWPVRGAKRPAARYPKRNLHREIRIEKEVTSAVAQKDDNACNTLEGGPKNS